MQHPQKWGRIFLATVLALSLAACALPRPLPSRPLRVYVLDGGTVEVLDISMFHPGTGAGERKMLADTCYLVVHPKGTLVWDTGLSDELANTPQGKKFMDAFVMRVQKTLAAQLKQIGYPPDTIKYLALSHLHGDHVGNVALFPQATLLIQETEYEAALGSGAGDYGLDPATYQTLRSFRVTKKLEGDYDVFGDGTVVIKSMPGHTAGNQALFLKLHKTGNVLISGDLVHFTENWTNKGVPSFNFDKDQSLASMEEAKKFLRENNAVLWIQHDLEQNAGLRHAPSYYE